MDHGSSLEGGYGIGASIDHVDAANAAQVKIADAELLFRGQFARSGPDLILTGEDGHRLLVTDYFASEKHPDLVAPNGAHLTGDLVGLLAGSHTHGQYAQAGAALAPEAIGKVEKIVGQVTLIHNGVAGPLHVGDPVFKTDVVQTGPNSSCGIAFPDGTALDLVNNTRMALNEYNYSPNEASNGAVFSLVQGTFAFVAGKVAHTGEGMKINTPVATMGIRGTVGLFRSEPTVINANLGHVWSVFLHEDIDGSHHLGRIALIDQDPTSPTFGETFYLLDSSEYIAYLEPQGPGLPPHVRLEPITNSKMFDDRHFYDDLGQILTAFETGTVNPQSVPGTPGSGDNPTELFSPPQFGDPSLPPFFDRAFPTGSGGPLVIPPPPGGSLPPIPVQPGANPNLPNGPTTNGPTPPQPPTPPTPSTHFIWNSTGPESWSQAIANWSQGSAPNSPIDTVEIKSGTSNYDLHTTTTIAFLTVDPGATLNIKAGELIVGGLDDEGTININSDPLFMVNGPATIGNGHTLTVDGKGNETDFNGTLVNRGTVSASQGGKVLVESSGTNDGKIEGTRGGEIIFQGDKGVLFDNDGLIAAKHHGAVTFDGVAITNEAISGYASLKPAAITSTGRGSIVTFSGGATLTNYGLVLAVDHGRVAFDGIFVNNQPNDRSESTDDTTGVPGKIEADGRGSVVSFSNGAELDNLGLVEARDHGRLSFAGSTLKNQDGGEVEATQHGRVEIKDATVTNDGDILAEDRGAVQIDKTVLDNDARGLIEAAQDGTVSFDHSHVENERHATIDADGCGAEITFRHSGIDNSGRIEAEHDGTVSFDRSRVDNKHGGTIAADGSDSLVTFDHSHLQNSGSVEAKDGGVVQFDCSSVDNQRDGTIKAKGDGSSVEFFGDKVDNWGLLAATFGGAVLLDFSLISNARGATIDADGCGSQITFDHDGLTNSGLVEAVQHGAVVFDGSFIANERHGTIEADGRGSSVTLDHSHLQNFGRVEANDHGVVRFDCSGIDNERRGTIAADGRGSSVQFFGSKVDNSGSIAASFGGTVLFDYSLISNARGGSIDADGCGSQVTFDHDWVVNSGKVDAAVRGSVLFEGSFVANERHGAIEADGWGSSIAFDGSDVGNLGRVEAKDAGVIRFDFSNINNERGGTIEADGRGSKVQFFASKVDNWGSIAATLGGLVLLDYSWISNARGATIDADGRGSQVTFDHDRIDNSGHVDAAQRGAVVFENSFVTNERHGAIEATGSSSEVAFADSYVRNHGVIEAAAGGTISVDSSIIDNRGGNIEAIGHDAAIDLDHAVIVGGTLETKSGGIIETVSGTSTLDDVTIAGNSHVDVGRGTNLTLSGGTTMLGGTLDIERHATLDIESRAGATLNDVHVVNGGNIEIDRPHERATLTLENGTTIDGGKLSIGVHGELDIEGGRHGGATLDDVNVLSDGIIRVDDSAPATLHLTDGTAIHGGALWVGCHGTVDIDSSKGATLDDVSVWNDGTITFGAIAEGDHVSGGADLFIAGTVTLQGSGDLVLAGNADGIFGAKGGGELVNDSNIVGAGHIGNGDGSLKLINGSWGVIDANHGGETLVLDTGHQTIVNDGLLAASDHGTLSVESTLDNSCGSIAACSGGVVDLHGLVLGGSATIDGGTLSYTAALGVETTFANNTPGEPSTLVLNGTGLSFITDAISGFSHGDVIDLADIAFNASTSFKLFGDFLTVYDGSHGPSITIQLDGDYNAGNIVLSQDKNGGTDITFNSSLLVTGTETTSDSYHSTTQFHGADEIRGSVAGDILFDDPNGGRVSATYQADGNDYKGAFHVETHNASDGTGSVDWTFDFSNVAVQPGKTLTQSYDVSLEQNGATTSQQVSVSIGGPGNDTFHFNPGVGADTIVNFNAQNDHIDLGNFANIQNYHELQEAITQDAHGDAVIGLGHGDSVTVAGLSENALKASLHSLVHLA